MRNNVTIISQPTAVEQTPHPSSAIPSIRLISATPSAVGNSSTSSVTNYAIDSSWGSIPQPLAPKDKSPATRKRLVPKKSKLSILTSGSVREKEPTTDLSDVVRRVGGTSLTGSASARGGFEIYVDQTIDDEIGEIVIVKKKKSRSGLDGVRWGPLGEVTNVPAVTAPKEIPALRKVKGEEKDKWWSLRRGPKDPKEKREQHNEKSKKRSKSPEPVKDPYPRSKTPEPLRPTQPTESSRARFNSLDSGLLLATPIAIAPGLSSTQCLPRTESPHLTEAVETRPPILERAGTPTAGGLLAPPIAGHQANTNSQGSIALRAMRSMRSLAHIGSWAQLRSSDENNPVVGSVKIKPSKEKREKTLKEKKKGEGKEKKKEKDGEGVKKKVKKKSMKEEEDAAQTIRMSTSSFEIGQASPLPKGNTKTLGAKKHSILGLGLPSTISAMTIRRPVVRNGSTASSIAQSSSSNRLSAESAHVLNQGRDRAGSVISTSTTSSLRPLSTTSSMSGNSRTSSGSSVHWDEDRLKNVKELRNRERKERGRMEEDSKSTKKGKSKEKENRRDSEGRRRTPLSDIFPIFRSESPASERHPEPPILTVEAATSDGHGTPDDCSIAQSVESVEQQPLTTPLKKVRPRPMSEQLLGKSRPRPFYEDEDGVISILDAATNDLAQLINHLDLEATPATPDMTPARQASLQKKRNNNDYAPDSPTKAKATHLEMPATSPGRKLPHNVSSITSLRPYAQSRKNTLSIEGPLSHPSIGQPITPWPTLLQDLSPVKPLPVSSPSKTSTTPVRTLRKTHRRTMSPAPEPEPEPVFQPLRPAISKNALAVLKTPLEFAPQKGDEALINEDVRAPSLRTFGSISSTRGSPLAADASGILETSPTPSPVFKRATGRKHRRSPLVQLGDPEISDDGDSVPIPPGARRILGMSGTMGGSDVSCYAVPELDASDPDSDIPEELQNILSGQSDYGDTLSYTGGHGVDTADSPTETELPGPPVLGLPTFHTELVDGDDSPHDLDNGVGLSDEENTKKSFDFTGEIQKLNESGDSDRHSFIEQLENAFRTPAKIDLRYGFNSSLLNIPVPPVPRLPQPGNTSSQSDSVVDNYSGSVIVDMKEPTLLHAQDTDDSTEERTQESQFESFSGPQLIDVKEPTLLPGSDSLASNSDSHDVIMPDDSARSLRSSSSSGSQQSEGQLNLSFKFGGLPKAPQPTVPSPSQDRPQTLADIIPPPAHVRSTSHSSIMEEDDSVLKSILAKASDIPRPRVRINSGISAKKRAERQSVRYRHSRHSSGMSFVGFESFDEVRRGFEFSTDRPFYPPPAARHGRSKHGREESLFSIASVSSYGRPHDYGLKDPFDYGLPSLRERASSEDLSISMSISVDDTFSFIGHTRRRVESDASSFYFKAPMQSFTRGHRHRESNMSVSSMAPPVSLYNRSFGTHRRNESTSSAQSVAWSYATHGASGGRAAWARHRQDASMDSVMSDFSASRLGRPGIGDKMFSTSADQGMPLTSISASPSESVTEQYMEQQPSYDYDSIMDHDQRSSIDDSLFEMTGDRSSVTSDSVFGCDDPQRPKEHLMPPPQYRPLSVLSTNSIHSPVREDDTMISMLGGGHVRRRSIDASPCVRIEKRKLPFLHDNQGSNEYRESPNKARILEKPSIASTSSFTFGGERMIKARHGLLERQSLEESCLIAEGEDMSAPFQNLETFSHPGAARSRSSTCTTSSSGGDTPPLSSSDGFSSMDEGSQSSIDLSQIDIALANTTYPIGSLGPNRVRARARGRGHRRRASHMRASRSSVYETIEEEMLNSPSPRQSPASKKSGSPTTCQPIFIVDPDTTAASPDQPVWDDENGIVTLRKYYALKDEAHTTVAESKVAWVDTPFSLFAVQSFQPPRHPAGMQALLEHSVQTFGPLPSELRPRRIRSRTSSRASPYPQSRISKASIPPSEIALPPINKSTNAHRSIGTPVLQSIPVNRNINVTISPAPSLDALKPFSPLVMDDVVEPKRENAFGLAPHARPRVGSAARRTALGWTKRSTGHKSSTEQKENAVGQGMMMTPGETLRIHRPRPRARQTPATAARPIRV